MNPVPRVLSCDPASDAEVRTGLLGYVSVNYGGLVIDGITVRRTAEGNIVLSFPKRMDGSGRYRSHIRPEDQEVRQAIEAAVLRQVVEFEGVAW